ncbi:DUF1311 domain-containing protein [Aquincola sp. S2]|uniref:DUF1311 domain-containing protein n=1 Tax=Pseudaquabacterium terrae TaxID=2732868 RepID=A0ABX2EP73_9BURK|nr:lysozyme inhibitor LprI family protein [Aquabacterium terrae]NRF70284.1 DUF1311 domain-containing protein [Aquabacterium terrae]
MLARSLLLLLFLGSAQAASFDCAKAGTQVERLICTNAELSDLDELLAEMFQLELEREHAAQRLKSAQRAWLVTRNQCTDMPCIKQRHDERIAELACDRDGRMAGSALGSNRCTSFQLRLLERQLPPLEERRRTLVVDSSNNREHAQRVLAQEVTAWRTYRDATCALYGETEGGSDGWKNAFAGACLLEETKKRIANLRSEVGKK